MTELQDTLQRWLTAEVRRLELEREYTRLIAENYDLRMKLLHAETQVLITQGITQSLATAMLTR